MTTYSLGCRKDKADTRDYLMRAYLPVKKLPARIDHSSRMTPVRDQGDEGTCVGFASAVGMKEYQEQVDYGKLVRLSPRFVYQQCKLIDGSPDSEGTSIRVAMKVLNKVGVCLENLWPYIPHNPGKPKPGLVASARKFRTLTYARILDLHELRTALAETGPCVIGIQVFPGMMQARGGLVPMPGRNERSIGGHAICPVGYDDKKKLVKFKNSWSAKWGDRGYGYLPYKYIEEFMLDAWSAVDIDDPTPLTIAKVMTAVTCR